MKECPEYQRNQTWAVLSENDTYDTKGKCCCNCQNQRPIHAHPWNKSKFAKGSIMKQIGWGCVTGEFYPNITFFDKEHGMCECYIERKEVDVPTP